MLISSTMENLTMSFKDANDVCCLKGVLVLNKITPVINALFGHCSLTQSENPGTAHVRYSFLIDHGSPTETCWRDIVRNLRQVADGAGLELSPTTPAMEVLAALSRHFSGRARVLIPVDLEAWLDDAFGRPGPDKLFAIAITLNDGHGLTALMTEGAWQRNSDLGGQGIYCSREFSVATSSLQASEFGTNVSGALLAGMNGTAAFHFQCAIEGLLAGIASRNTREAIRRRLALSLQRPAPFMPDRQPIFGPCVIDLVADRCEWSSTL